MDKTFQKRIRKRCDVRKQLSTLILTGTELIGPGNAFRVFVVVNCESAQQAANVRRHFCDLTTKMNMGNWVSDFLQVSQ